MNFLKILGTFVIYFLNFDYGECVAPLIAIAVGGFSVVVGIGYLSCNFIECCTNDYISTDLNLLDESLNKKIHDQHLALEIIYRALKSHIANDKPKKALALSFQGSSGTGKNYMVDLIVDTIYKKGSQSKYVHYYNGHLEFPLRENLSYYQHQIKEHITKHLKSCPRSIFVYDNVDHMPDGILDALQPFLDYNPRVIDLDPTRAIFIFISNIGAALLEKKLIKMWQAGVKREETKLKDFEALLATSAFHEQSAFHKSTAMQFDFIDHYIPFLPFEERHVRKCIVDAFKERNVEIKPSDEMIQEVMTHMKFGPPPHNLYSYSGCKRVNSKVASIIESQKLRNYEKNYHHDGNR